MLVQADGSVRVLDVSDFNNLGFDFQFEAIRAGTSSGGKWIPAMFEGRNVTTMVTGSVFFEPTQRECLLVGRILRTGKYNY